MKEIKEHTLVKIIVDNLIKKNYSIGLEVPNFHRSADIAAINESGDIIIIECKIRDISKAIKQTLTHKLSADKVYICTIKRNIKKDTIGEIKKAGVGLIFLCSDNSIEYFIEPTHSLPAVLVKNILFNRIKECLHNGTDITF